MEDGENAPPGASDAHEQKAHLACERCKRRKIKCDRTLPICRTCQKTKHSCVYPASSLKPGPKPGAPQRRRISRQVNAEPNNTYPTLASSNDSYPTSNATENGSEGAPLNVFQSASQSQQSQQTPQLSVSSPGTDRSTSRVAALSNILHLSHDPLPNDDTDAPGTDPKIGYWRGIDAVCNDLGINSDVYTYLLNAFFDNVTAFSLFHRPTFTAKLSSISCPIQQRALLASMFALSSKFVDSNQSRLLARSNIPNYDHFRLMAEQSVDQALTECLDESPPLCVLQALILTTFQQLTNGVRGRSWRALHTCVSIAYDLHLHLIDKSVGPNHSETENVYLEEKRRAWWTLWEFDVFASTVRKLPTAIDWANNETWLPIEDDLWFNNTPAQSCVLLPDPAVAWKALEKTGNQSARAWFIVTNALMRCAHIIAFPNVYSNNDSFHGESSSASDITQPVQSNLDVLSNSLYCLSLALPMHLCYNGEFLNFSPGSSLQVESAKHGIHIMMNLCRFMVHYLKVFNSTYRQLEPGNSSPGDERAPVNSLDSTEKAAWNVYLAAASEIVNLIRNSSPKHVRYVNPFLASTIWLAAAAQIISQKVALHVVNRRVTSSNLDVLQINLDAFVSFWGVSNTLQQKLKALNAKLETLNAPAKIPDKSGTVRNLNGNDTADLGVSCPRVFGEGFPNSGMSTIPPVTQKTYNTLSMNSTNGHNGDIWTAAPNFNFDGTPDLGSDNIWGYGLDELLTYGGFE